MTMFKPCLSVNRMIVKRGPHEVYHARFKAGLNIISGENSSGKSTILDFLFYGMGGDIVEWREAALACTEVIVEVNFNGHPATLSREISSKPQRSMKIFTGNLEEAHTADANWGIYPYKRSQEKESFSQVMFRLLGMPEATGDLNSNVTMHQIMRVLYADQLSPIDRIFRFEAFDTALTRQTVGDLLCGAYDNALYRRQLRLKEAEKAYATLTNEWRTALSVFKGVEHAVTLEWVDAERAVLLQRLDQVRTESENLEERIFNAEMSDGLTLSEQKTAYQQMVKAQQALLDRQQEYDALQLEIADSNDFIRSLEARLDALRDSEITAC